MYSIGIIAVAASLKNIMEIAPQMQEQCNVTFLTYTSNDNLVYIYQQNVNQFDALLFGGSYTYNILLERVGSMNAAIAGHGAHQHGQAAGQHRLFASRSAAEGLVNLTHGRSPPGSAGSSPKG